MAKLLKESRKFLRFPVSVPVHLDKKQENYSTICSNISQKGLYLETSEKLKKGEMICIQLSLSPKGEPVKVLGEVMWASSTGSKDYSNRPVKGFGIRFRANMKDSLDVQNGILQKERWQPSPEKDTPEFIIPRRSMLDC